MSDFVRSNPANESLAAACRECGIRSLDTFEQRYGVSVKDVTVDEALALVLLPDRPRRRDRSTWTPVQRTTYAEGCEIALTALRQRLERGLVILAEDRTIAAEGRWRRLASRAIRLIGKQAYASTDRGVTFRESALGQWYFDLAWPEPSDERSETTRETGDLMHTWRRDLARKGMAGFPVPPVPPAVHRLHSWYGAGMLDNLPQCIPGFTGELARYTGRARLILMVRAILDSAPWSLTAQERAVQFVTVFSPLINERAS